MVKTTQKSDLPWSSIFSVIVYCSFKVIVALRYNLILYNLLGTILFILVEWYRPSYIFVPC